MYLHCCGRSQLFIALCWIFIQHFQSFRTRICTSPWSMPWYGLHVDLHIWSSTSFGRGSKQTQFLDLGEHGSKTFHPHFLKPCAMYDCNYFVDDSHCYKHHWFIGMTNFWSYHNLRSSTFTSYWLLGVAHQLSFYRHQCLGYLDYLRFCPLFLKSRHRTAQ